MMKKFKKVEDLDNLSFSSVKKEPTQKTHIKKETKQEIPTEENAQEVTQKVKPEHQPEVSSLTTDDLMDFSGIDNLAEAKHEEVKMESASVESAKEEISKEGIEKLAKINDNKKPKKKKNESVIKKSEFAESHSKEELEEYGRTKLKEICYEESMIETLFPLICQDLIGFKGVFIGDKGGLKGEFMDNLVDLLYDIGKISEPSYEAVPFAHIPEKFDIDKIYFIEDLNDAVINLFNLDDLSQTSSVTQQEYRTKMENLIKAAGNTYIILDTMDTELKGFLTLDARLPFIYGRKVAFKNLSNEAIVERFYNALDEYHQKFVGKDEKDYLLGYLERNRRYFPFDNQELATYLANYTSQYQELKLPKEKYNAKTLEESFKSIVGMEVVKKQIKELSEYLVIRQKLEKAGIKLPPFNLHMMFLGNPGVGKTTIARIIAKVLFDLGYIREEKLVEVTSKDLVSAYGNQTGIKTNKVIMNAMGGVLFVDEAYSLAISCGASGAEAIANLIKAMEDYKGDLVVMFAGYSLEMQEFVRSNSGIASRISYVFEFSDYTTEELFKIFEIKLANTGMIFGEDAKEPVMKLCKFAAGRRNFGNGRFVDKLLQRALTKHATLDLPADKMLVLTKDSIPEVEEIMASFGRFGA